MSGVGVDIVQISQFTAQFAQPGSTFVRSFSAREIRLARQRAVQTGNLPEYHLAARWAGKEAFIKAWSNILLGKPPVVKAQEIDFAQIEVLADAYGRPYLHLSEQLQEEFARSVAGEVFNPHPLISLSHDGDYAIAYVVIKGCETN